MKRIYATLALLGAAFTGSFAQESKQIDLKLTLLTPSGSYENFDVLDTMRLSFEITNNGPDDIAPSDTLEYILDTRIFGADVYAVQKYVPLGGPPLTIPAGGKDTLYLSMVEGTEFFSSNPALIEFPKDSKICTYIAGWGMTADRFFFVDDEGFDPEAFNTATTQDELLAAFSGSNKGTADVTFGTGATTISTCVTSVNEVNYEKQTLNVYPNPASSLVNFDFDFGPKSSAVVKVADVTGRTVLVKDFGTQSGESRLSLDVSSLVSGMYFVELTTNDKKAITKITVRK